MKRHSIIAFPLLYALTAIASFAGAQPQVRLGCDVLIADSLHLLEGRRVGLLANHTSRLSDGTFLYDVLRAHPRVQLAAVFSPEHGFHGTADDGALVSSGRIDDYPLHSLYGSARRPSPAMLEGIDILVMDLQDIGSRYYTYVSTMAHCLESAADAGIPVIITDRPNPLGGEQIEGVIVADSLRSFVGIYPVPVRHGMTVGELALMAVGERWLRGGAHPALHVITMQGWERPMYYDDTGLPWINPSPNMVSLDAAIAYVGTCLVEGSTLSVGRGTDIPFLQFGAPYIDAQDLAVRLNALSFEGVVFEPVQYMPRARTGASRPRFAGEECGGVRIHMTDRARFRPWRIGVEILHTVRDHYGEKVRFTSYLSTLAGMDSLMSATRDALLRRERVDCDEFSRKRASYLLYR